MSDDNAKFVQEARAGLESFTKKDRSFDCRRCGTHYVPADGQWIFYELCDGCFARFDEQKMTGRCIAMGMTPDDGKRHYEAAADWIAADVASGVKQ